MNDPNGETMSKLQKGNIMRKVLIAFDGSEGAMAAVDYVGRQFSGLTGMKIILFYVLPQLPPLLWDDGHILTPGERMDRQRVVETWASNQKTRMEGLFDEARKLLVKRGIKKSQIEQKIRLDFNNVADGILDEAFSGGYLTLVLGRCGASRMTHLLTGSVASKIVNRGVGLAICLVDPGRLRAG